MSAPRPAGLYANSNSEYLSARELGMDVEEYMKVGKTKEKKACFLTEVIHCDYLYMSGKSKSLGGKIMWALSE